MHGRTILIGRHNLHGSTLIELLIVAVNPRNARIRHDPFDHSVSIGMRHDPGDIRRVGP